MGGDGSLESSLERQEQIKEIQHQLNESLTAHQQQRRQMMEEVVSDVSQALRIANGYFSHYTPAECISIIDKIYQAFGETMPNEAVEEWYE